MQRFLKHVAGAKPRAEEVCAHNFLFNVKVRTPVDGSYVKH